MTSVTYLYLRSTVAYGGEFDVDKNHRENGVEKCKRVSGVCVNAELRIRV